MHPHTLSRGGCFHVSGFILLFSLHRLTHQSIYYITWIYIHKLLIWMWDRVGIKSFTNNTGSALHVCIFVRAGSQPGCVLRCICFCLIANETKVITYGNECNPFLDGVKAYQCTNGQYLCTKTCVTERGSDADNLLNTNSKIYFCLENSSIVVSASN